jgi:hypothetical protein
LMHGILESSWKIYVTGASQASIKDIEKDALINVGPDYVPLLDRKNPPVWFTSKNRNMIFVYRHSLLLDMAKSLIQKLEYDRKSWKVSASLSEDKLDSIVFIVDTMHPYEATNVFSCAWEYIPCEAFVSGKKLKADMTLLVEKLISRIKSLPPPTNELIEMAALEEISS